MAMPKPGTSADPAVGGGVIALRQNAVRAVLAMSMAISLAACSGGGTDRDGAPSAAMPAPTEPLAVDTPPPEYPIALACAGAGGEVGLALQIDVNGAPGDIRVEYSSRQPQLDAAAIAVVRTWRFRPATNRGQPVPTRIRVPVKFMPPAIKPDRCFALEEAQRRGQ